MENLFFKANHHKSSKYMGNFDIPICKQKSRETLFYSIALLNFEYWESMPLCAMSNSQTLLPSCQVMLPRSCFWRRCLLQDSFPGELFDAPAFFPGDFVTKISVFYIRFKPWSCGGWTIKKMDLTTDECGWIPHTIPMSMRKHNCDQLSEHHSS